MGIRFLGWLVTALLTGLTNFWAKATYPIFISVWYSIWDVLFGKDVEIKSEQK